MMISVIIPYHNAPVKLFGMCMQSLFAQTYKDFEVVIVDDGSDEEYQPILEEARKADARIRIIHQNCCGASAARNRGIKEARADLLAFVDADDMITVNYLEEALKILIANDADLVAGGVKFVWKLEDMLPSFLAARESLDAAKVICFSGKDIETFKNCLASSRKLLKYFEGNVDRGPVARLIRKDIAIQCLFHDELTMWEDMVWNLEVLNKCKKVCAVKKTWYLYYQNPTSSIHRYRPNVVNEVKMTMKYVEKLLDTDTDDGFETYGDHVYDNIRRVYRLYFSKAECPLTPVEKKEAYREIYTTVPWSIFGSDRYYGLTGGKNKIMSFFYRRKLFFAVFDIKEKIKAKLKIT